MKKKTIILDTDLATDIDDSWAIAMLLNSPELDLKLLTTVTADTQYRAVAAERIIEASGHTGIKIAAGIKSNPSAQLTLMDYLKDDPRLGTKQYPDAVRSIIDFVKAAPEPVTLIAIAPLSNIAAAVSEAPEIAEKIDLVAMLGSIYKKYDGTPGFDREYNVMADIPASKIVFNETKWHSFTMTPLDTCGDIRIPAEEMLRLQKVSPMMNEVVSSNFDWNWWPVKQGHKMPEFSSVLYDTVAVYMSYDLSLLEMKTLPVACDDIGNTVIREGANPVRVALNWKDKPAYIAHLIKRLEA